MHWPTGLRLEDFCEVPDDRDLPPLDRAGAEPQSAEQALWKSDGFLVLKSFLPDHLVDAYNAVRAPLGDAGFGVGHPYMECPELLDLACYRPLTQMIAHLIGEECGLHLNLTGWVSTERNWHQDDYLNHDGMNAHYCAVWMALDDIDPRSGPFQCVPGSHRWPLFRRRKLFNCLTPGEQLDPMWPKFTEDYVSGLFADKIAREGASVFTFLPKKGDVLLWHGRLCHRGSKPEVPGMQRKCVINHYSALSRRTDMPNRGQLSNGSYYFVL